MRKLPPRSTVSEQVYQAILDEVCGGRLSPGMHLVQEELAARLGVSRQPVQQAMAMLKADGVVEERGARGLHVAPLDLASMRHRYAIRGTLDALAARGVALAVQAGDLTILPQARRLIDSGRAAIAAGDIRALVAADVGFHQFVYGASGNPLIAATAELHWRFLRRVMADVLLHAEPPFEIWDQHEAIVAAIAAGDGEAAGQRAHDHVLHAADRLTSAMAKWRTAEPSPRQGAFVA